MEGVGDVRRCLDARVGNGRISNPRTSQKGGRWADAYAAYQLFHTVVPPNGPSCGNGGDNIVHAASSFHPGGVNVAFLDGSVRFVPDSVSAGNPQLDWTVTRTSETGPSRFGVWGALSTRDGGEAATL